MWFARACPVNVWNAERTAVLSMIFVYDTGHEIPDSVALDDRYTGRPDA